MTDPIENLISQAEKACAESFARADEIARINTEKVLRAFRTQRVALTDFAPTSGYGYDDVGRDKLDRVYAEALGAEKALVRTQFFNGTHTIAVALYATLRPGDTLLSAVDAPYDTLQNVISGQNGEGSLEELGVKYDQQEFLPDFEAYLSALSEKVKACDPKTVLIQRSRGYTQRRALRVEEIGRIIRSVRGVKPDAVIIVDNCYGEFTETCEPTALGADLICGSLIKNPGGGLAPCGGYVAGKAGIVDLCAARLTVPGIGGEVGCFPGGYRELYQGFFMAPHIVAQAVKTAILAAKLFGDLGYRVSPAFDTERSDIIQTLTFGEADPMVSFCKGIQSGSPVDSFVTPEPWEMPGYGDPVIMAAGAFVQGSSIELSADGPLRAPYTVYLQGGLTYEAGRAGLKMALEKMNCK